MGAKNGVQVENVTRQQTLVRDGRVADSFFTRLVGLMGSGPLQPGQGLLIVPSNSIHTQFMRFPIDVVYVSRKMQVVHVDADMAPWRFGRIHREARFVIELPAGTAAATGTQPGDQLQIDGYAF